MTIVPETIKVFRDDLLVNHFPSQHRPEQTACGFDTAFMQELDWPLSHASKWCGHCAKTPYILGNFGTPSSSPQ